MRRILLLLLLVLAPATASAETLLETMQRLRKEYGTFDRKTAGEFLNRVAWIHRVEGYALLGKKAGNNCDMPNGQLISCDFMIQNVNGVWRGWDVLIAWDAAGTPTHGGDGEDMTEALRSGARSVVQAVDPGNDNGGGNGSGGGDPDTAAKIAALEQQAAALAARLANVETDNQALREHAGALANAINEQARVLNDAIANLAAQIPGGCRAAINLGGVKIPISCGLTGR